MSDYPVLYTFDLNRRVYEKSPLTGYGQGGPIYAEHYQRVEITGENEKEYVTSWGTINKKSMKLKSKYGKNYSTLYTEAEREADIWRREHRYKITKACEKCNDVDVLKQIAELLEYNPS